MTKKEDKTFFRTCEGKRQACTESKESIVPSYMWHNNVKAPVDNTWQISPLCHLQLLRSFVLDGTDNDASVVTAEKVFSTRQKARALTASSRVLRKRVGNGATPPASNQDVERSRKTAQMHAFGIPTGDTLRKAYHEVGEGSKCNPGENNDNQDPT